jgi:hypothetical protein
LNHSEIPIAEDIGLITIVVAGLSSMTRSTAWSSLKKIATAPTTEAVLPARTTTTSRWPSPTRVSSTTIRH